MRYGTASANGRSAVLGTENVPPVLGSLGGDPATSPRGCRCHRGALSGRQPFIAPAVTFVFVGAQFRGEQCAALGQSGGTVGPGRPARGTPVTHANRDEGRQAIDNT